MRQGTSRDGKEWKSQEFIFEFFRNERATVTDKAMLSILNDRIAQYDIHVGDEVRIGIGHNTEEWNGRTYNRLWVYSFERLRTAMPQQTQQVMAAPPQQAPQAPQQTIIETGEAKNDDLPF